jgi:hypothetical protein
MPTGRGGLVLTALALAGIALLGAACSSSDPVDPADIAFPPVETTAAGPTVSAPDVGPTATIAPVDGASEPPHGGVVRLAVWSEPDPNLDTLAGAAVRSLVYPQLFEAAPNGAWLAGVVEPGSDVDGPEFRSAVFRLRSNASWSDGTPITAADLERSADGTFVVGVEVDNNGLITVYFNQPLLNWRRLWSGDAAITPAAAGLYGGPFIISSLTPGLETVLVPNKAWWGAGPYLDELRLLVVPDQQVQMELFANGEVDVIAPMPDTGRLPTLGAIAAERFDVAAGDGWWFGLTVDPDQVALRNRVLLADAADVGSLTSALLKGEVARLDDLSSYPNADSVLDGPFDPPPLSRLAEAVSLVSPNDLPVADVAHRAVLLPIRSAGGAVPELREATSADAEVWGTTAAAYLGLHYDGPGGPCWTCRFAATDEVAMRLADGGAAAPTAVLEAEGVVDPWWRPIVAVAWADGIHGVVANGWSITPAWNAEQWWIDTD